MNSGERFRGFKNPEAPEGYVGVHFWDLREDKKAKKVGVAPGFYFTAGPASQKLLQNPNLISTLSPYLLDILSQENLVGNPSPPWRFTQKEIVGDSLLLIHAEQIPPDDINDDTVLIGVKRKSTIPFDRTKK